MRSRSHREAGYVMAALLVAMSVMAIAMSVLVPVWSTAARREREAELVFRGEQYARAIGLFQRKYANALPPNLDVLVNERFLRKKYKDPITGEEFQLLAAGALQGAGGSAPAAGRSVNSSGNAPARGAATTAARGGLSVTGQAQTNLAQTASRLVQAAQTARQTAQAGQAGRQGGAPGTPAASGIMGVASKSTEKSLRLYGGREHYNEWVFVALQMSTQAGGPAGAQTPGGRAGTAPGGRAGARGAPGRGSDGRGAPLGIRGTTPGGSNQRGR